MADTEKLVEANTDLIKRLTKLEMEVFNTYHSIFPKAELRSDATTCLKVIAHLCPKDTEVT